MGSRISRFGFSAAILAVLGLWLLFALADATRQVWHRHRAELFHEWEVMRWTPGAPPQRRLEHFLRTVEPTVPPGSDVLFTSILDGESDQALPLYLWAAHLWPDRDVRPWAGEEGLSRADYWIAYRDEARHPRAVPIRREPGGTVYRIAP